MSDDKSDEPITLAESIRRKISEAQASGHTEVRKSSDLDPANTEFFSRYRFVQPLGQCSRSVFYLAFDKAAKSHAIVKQYISEEEGEEREFEDEVHRLEALRSSGLIQSFDKHTSDGKFFLVVEVDTACEWLCIHLGRESVKELINSLPQ